MGREPELRRALADALGRRRVGVHDPGYIGKSNAVLHADRQLADQVAGVRRNN